MQECLHSDSSTSSIEVGALLNRENTPLNEMVETENNKPAYSADIAVEVQQLLLSKLPALKKRVRAKEAQIARMKSKLASFGHPDADSGGEEEESSSTSDDFHHECQSPMARQRDALLAMTVQKKRQVRHRKRRFAQLELQMSTLQAIQMATCRFENLRQSPTDEGPPFDSIEVSPEPFPTNDCGSLQ